MAKRTPLTFQEERLQRLTRNAELKIVALKEMIDTAAKIVTAQSVDVGTPPQTIELSEDGSIALGDDTVWKSPGAITESVTHTGDTIETTVGQIDILADSIGANGEIRITSAWERLAGLGQSNFRIYFGQILAGNLVGLLDAGAGVLWARPVSVWNKNATNVQGAVGADVSLQTHFANPGSVISMAEDTTAAVTIFFTIQNNAAGRTSTLHSALVEVLHRD